MYRLLTFIIGFILSVYGLSFIIIYLNLLTMGYTFIEYLGFIFKKIECITFFIGYFLIILSIFINKERKQYVLHL